MSQLLADWGVTVLDVCHFATCVFLFSPQQILQRMLICTFNRRHKDADWSRRPAWWVASSAVLMSHRCPQWLEQKPCCPATGEEHWRWFSCSTSGKDMQEISMEIWLCKEAKPVKYSMYHRKDNNKETYFSHRSVIHLFNYGFIILRHTHPVGTGGTNLSCYICLGSQPAKILNSASHLPPLSLPLLLQPLPW